MSELQAIKHIIAVASGKGGVGKSTTTMNLAVALREQNLSVGLLDADIYGPSQAMMLGLPESTRPEVISEGGVQRFVPVPAQGLQTMSMAYLVGENTPMVWRGPMASGALQQMLEQTRWGELDVLLVDMPPGTGDIQLTLSQKAPLSGALIVTTPQTIALLDAVKAIEMFNKVNVPVLGIVENMATHICTQCGHEDALFGSGGGQHIATQYNSELLGAIPLARTIRENTDSGTPALEFDHGGPIAAAYAAIATKLQQQLAGLTAQSGPVLSVSDD